jgi:hypothetical protein
MFEVMQKTSVEHPNELPAHFANLLCKEGVLRTEEAASQIDRTPSSNPPSLFVEGVFSSSQLKEFMSQDNDNIFGSLNKLLLTINQKTKKFEGLLFGMESRKKKEAKKGQVERLKQKFPKSFT